MAARGRLGRLCQALLVSASMIAFSVGIARAQEGGELENLNQRILENPQDADLNLQYARAAEAAGKPRLALAAYERILINDPSNQEARRGYERVRRALEPGYTLTRVEVGVRHDTNALNSAEGYFILNTDDAEATTYYASAMVANEQEFAGRRWRSILNVALEETPDIDELDYAYLGAQTGPIFYAGPHVAVLPAVGVGASWLGGDFYYSEINASLTLEGRMTGASYWARLRGGYRDYDTDSNAFFNTVTEHGPYAELQAGITKPRLLSERDTLLVRPFAKWSDVEGSVFNITLLEDLAPGQYVEYGVDVNYTYQLTDHLQVSAGILLRERDFSDSSREDTYVAPQASLIWQDALPCECDIGLQYRHRDNDSNDFLAEYDADQVSLFLRARF